mmetsp:Transcript_72913/g.141068  ORF Transcript_72913/g.141068 Transcript_72913/m.141068 type:complete len:157 (+) Transcript_72913:65-535(+)
MAEAIARTPAATTPFNAEREPVRRTWKVVVGVSEIEGHFPICFTKGSPTCAICLATIEETDPCRKTTCKHEFHAGCIMKWWTKEQDNALDCPTCREIQRVTVNKARQVNFEVRQKVPPLSPFMRLLECLRVVLPKAVRTPSSEATATTPNVMLGPS